MDQKPPTEATVQVKRPDQVSTTIVVSLHGHDGEIEETPIHAGEEVEIDLEAGDTLSVTEE
jgi:hypothetical protein